MTGIMQEKLGRLRACLEEIGSAAVAFSGGVDSTFLLKVAHDVLGERVMAFTAGSSFVPERDIAEARAFCEREGIRHIVKRFDVLSIDGIRQNPQDRCYRCKYALFHQFRSMAEERCLAAVVDGTNLDDDGDYRPGRRALKELGIRSPLHEAGLGKQEIRGLSRELGLPTWDKPSFACLASRFVYGEELTGEKLRQVNDAEEVLLRRGFRQFRVRRHGDLARIELLPEDISRFLSEDLRAEVAERFRRIGFSYVTLDLLGYRSGSMNETMEEKA